MKQFTLIALAALTCNQFASAVKLSMANPDSFDSPEAFEAYMEQQMIAQQAYLQQQAAEMPYIVDIETGEITYDTKAMTLAGSLLGESTPLEADIDGATISGAIETVNDIDVMPSYTIPYIDKLQEWEQEPIDPAVYLAPGTSEPFIEPLILEPTSTVTTTTTTAVEKPTTVVEDPVVEDPVVNKITDPTNDDTEPVIPTKKQKGNRGRKNRK